MLKKYGVRLETITEKFENTQTGKIVLGLRAAFSEAERDQIVMRTSRGKADRIAKGNLPGHGKPTYGYQFIDTDREPNARYIPNNDVVHTDREGTRWTELSVMQFLFHSVADGISMHCLARTLTQKGIPTPGGDGACWRAGTIVRLLKNPIYMGDTVVNRFQKVLVKTDNPRAKGKEVKRIVPRPVEEQIHLTDVAPAIVTKEVFERVQEQLAVNKQESSRNHHHEDALGILRSGFAHCAICGRNLRIRYHKVRLKRCYWMLKRKPKKWPKLKPRYRNSKRGLRKYARS